MNIPKGYKHTSLGILPQDWEVVELEKIIEIQTKKFNPQNSESKPCIELEHISQEMGNIVGYVDSTRQMSIKSIFSKRQILFGKLRPYLKKYWQATFDGVCSSEIWVLDGKKVCNDFLLYLVQTEKFIQIANISSGTKMPRADWHYMREIPFCVPPIKEQEKIAQILNTWDSCIHNLEKLIKTKERYKKGLMQRLLIPPQEDLTGGLPRSLTTFRNDGLALPLGGKHNEAIQNLDSKTLDCHDLQSKSRNDIQALRFKEFSGTWQEVKLGEVLEESSQRNKSLQIDNVLSVTNSMGFIQQKEYFEKEVASKNTSNYKIINYGEFAYNPARINVGSIALLDSYEIGILSPMYIVFKCVRVNKYFFKYWLDSFMFKGILGQFLAGSVRQVLAFSDMKQIKIYLPSLQEQEKIARVLSLCDEEIQTFKKMLESRKKQKRGLMQNLLNGKVRVKA